MAELLGIFLELFAAVLMLAFELLGMVLELVGGFIAGLFEAAVTPTSTPASAPEETAQPRG